REGAALRLGKGTAIAAAAAAAGEGKAGEQQPQGLAESFHVVVSRTASSRIRMPEASSMGVCAGAHLRLSLRIRGVTKIRSSALVSLRPLFLNRLPSTGMSPRSGTLVIVSDLLTSYTPPRTTVCPLSTRTWDATWRLSI